MEGFETILQAFLELQTNENTHRAYANDLKDFFQITGHVHFDPISISSKDIIIFRQKITEKNKPSTVVRKLIVVKRFFRFCLEKGLIAENPTNEVRIPRVDQESRTNGLTKKQAELLLRQPDRTTLIGKRDYAILSLLLYNGLRRSEVCNVRWGNFGEERGHFVLRIRGKGEKDFLTKIQPKVMKAIEGYKAASQRQWRPEISVFVAVRKAGRSESQEPLSPESIRVIVHKYANQAGIRKQISPHSLRHTAITMALDNGASIRQAQYMANHSDPKMTMRYDRNRSNLDHHGTDFINLDA